MRSLFSVLFFAVSSFAGLSVQSLESSLQSQNLSIPRIQFINNSQENINGFTAYYYFTSTEPNPVFESYDLRGGNGSVEHLGGVNYRIKLNFSSVSIPANSAFPDNSGISFGLHYANWANWRKDDDYSNNLAEFMTENNSVVVASSAGQILSGNYPDFNSDNNSSNNETAPLQKNMARVYALNEGSGNLDRIRLYVKNEGQEALNHFDFSIEITSENGKEPIFEAWYLPNTTYIKEKKNDSVWVFKFTVSGIALENNSVFPSEGGMSFGLHYDNWSEMNNANDYSLLGLQNQFSLAEKIPLYIDGKLISGNPKIRTIADIQEILAGNYGYSQNDFNISLESFAEMYDNSKKWTWDDLKNRANAVFLDLPSFDSTEQAFYQILDNFQGMDTLFLAENFKSVRAVYEQLARLKLAEYFEPELPKMRVLAKNLVGEVIDEVIDEVSDIYDDYDCNQYFIFNITKGEIDALFKHPLSVKAAVRAKELAEKWSKEYARYKEFFYKNEKLIPYGDSLITYANRADALRHAAWSMLTCTEAGWNFDYVDECLYWSEEITTAHEKKGDMEKCYNKLDTAMDLHNNKIGREAIKQKLHRTCGTEIPLLGICVDYIVKGLTREDVQRIALDEAENGYGFNSVQQLDSLPWQSTLVFRRADNGKYYCPQNPDDCIELENPNSSPVKIGLLIKNRFATCKDRVEIYLDLEDSNNDDKIISGDKSPPGIEIKENGVKFVYCTQNIDSIYGAIPRVPYDYIVLSLSDKCPNGTYPFSRYHDTEDDNNNNSYIGSIGRNVVERNATFEYCFVPADSNSNLEFPFSYDFGVFAKYSSSNIVHTELKLDDEDERNKNSWGWYRGTPDSVKENIQNIMNGKSNTIYHVVKYIEIVFNAILEFFAG